MQEEIALAIENAFRLRRSVRDGSCPGRV